VLLGKSRVWIKESLAGLAPAMFRLSKRTFYFFKILFFLVFVHWFCFCSVPPFTYQNKAFTFCFLRGKNRKPLLLSTVLSYSYIFTPPFARPSLLGQDIYRVTYLPIHSVPQVAVTRSPIKKQKLSTFVQSTQAHLI
jgi:hypothetical protein